METYYATHRATRLQYQREHYHTKDRPQQLMADTLLNTVVQAAYAGLPDALGSGAYLWHCGAWRKINDVPMTCPGCGRVFFEQD